MYFHIAVFDRKEGVTDEQMEKIMADTKALAETIGGVQIYAAANTSRQKDKYSYTTVVMADNQAAIDNYKSHPAHLAVSESVDALELTGIGIDISDQ